jgi:hypothetical protein
MSHALRRARMVVVTGLGRNATALEVQRHVESAGVEVEDVFVVRDDDEIVRGHAFVTMATDADAERLMATGLPDLAGRTLSVTRRQVRDRVVSDLFVKNLSRHVTEADLAALVSTVAEVAEVRIPCGPAGHGTGWAFVQLRHAEDAAAVIEALHGVALDGHPLEVLRDRERGA